MPRKTSPTEAITDVAFQLAALTRVLAAGLRDSDLPRKDVLICLDVLQHGLERIQDEASRLPPSAD